MLRMCCVLWDLHVCFLRQDGIYISDVNKRFVQGLSAWVQNAGLDLVSPVGEAERNCALSSAGTSSWCCDVGGFLLAGMVTPHSASI